MSDFRRQPGPFAAAWGPRHASGMTLMEIMVSVTILAGMIIAFNIILSQSQRIVSGSEKAIRANAAGMALSQAIRKDLATITKNGVLYVGNDTQGHNTMVFTTAGACESVTGNARANASVICYKLAQNAATGQFDVLCRKGVLLTTVAGTSVDTTPYDLADVQKMTLDQITSNIIDPMRNANSVTNVCIPAQTPTQVNALWQVLASNVNFSAVPILTIQYAKRNTNGTLAAWTSTPATWTYRNQDDWPVAVRIKFGLLPEAEMREALKDPDNPATAAEYEVICPIAN